MNLSTFCLARKPFKASCSSILQWQIHLSSTILNLTLSANLSFPTMRQHALHLLTATSLALARTLLRCHRKWLSFAAITIPLTRCSCDCACSEPCALLCVQCDTQCTMRQLTRSDASVPWATHKRDSIYKLRTNQVCHMISTTLENDRMSQTKRNLGNCIRVQENKEHCCTTCCRGVTLWTLGKDN